MFSAFNLNSTLSPAQSANPDDTLKTKHALYNIGYYEPPKLNKKSIGFTPYPDTPLFTGIQKFQSDHGLKPDGVMKPDGETAQTLNWTLAQSAQKKTPVKKQAQEMPGFIWPGLSPGEGSK